MTEGRDNAGAQERNFAYLDEQKGKLAVVRL